MDDAAAHLVDRLRAGEESAWREFMRSHGRLILAAARRAGLGTTDLEEAFQVACVEAYKSIGSLRDPSRLASWTYSIAFRWARKIRERQNPAGSPGAIADGSVVDVLPSGDPSPEDIAVRIDQAGRLHAGLAKLGFRCRRLIEALYLQAPRPSYQEIGRRLKLPIGSIGPTRARCLEKLRKVLLVVSPETRPGTTGRTSKGERPEGQ